MSTDIHAHLFPPRYLNFLTSKGGESERLADRIGADRTGRFMTGALDERLERMSAAGIDRQVLSIPNQWVLVEDGPRCVDHVVSANDAIAEVCAQRPKRFGLFASLPLVDPDAAVRELERARHELHAVGVIIPTNVLGRPLDWEGMETVYSALERLELPMFLHPAPPPYATKPEGYGDFGLTASLFYPVEDARALLRMVCSGAMERHPGLHVICPHLGGPIPFLFGRIARGAYPQMADGGKLLHPVEHYLKKVLYDTVAEHGPALRCACETFGTSQIVLGTDFPYGPGIEPIVALINKLEIDEAERAAIMETNVSTWVRF